MDEFRQNNDGTIASPTDFSTDPSHEEKPRRFRSWTGLAVILIVIGFIMIGVGRLSGSRGGRLYFNDGNGNMRIESFRRGEQSTGEAFDQTANIQASSVTVRTGVVNVTVVPTSEAYVRVTAPPGVELTFYESGGQLTITDGRAFRGGNVSFRSWNIISLGGVGIAHRRHTIDDARTSYLEFSVDRWFGPIRQYVRLYVPGNVQSLSVTTTTGTVRIDDIAVESLEVAATTGNIHINGTDSQQTNARTTTGSIHFESDVLRKGNFVATTGTVRVAGALEGGFYARTTTGSVHVNDLSTSHAGDEIALTATTGAIRFSTHAPQGLFNYNLIVTTGSIHIDGNRLTGRHASGGTGNTPLNIRTTTGSVHVGFGG
jgi:hypothetical protein